MKRIIFLRENIFTSLDFKRFGADILRKNGFRVEFWSAAAILYPKLSRVYDIGHEVGRGGLFLFDGMDELSECLSGLSEGDFVINLVTYNYKSLAIYKSLSSSQAGYALFCANVLPYADKNGLSHTYIEIFKKIAGLRHAKSWQRLVMKLPYRYFGVKGANLVLSGGEMCRNYYYGPFDKNTKILDIHSLDYDFYLKIKDEPWNERPIAVFLDEFFPFHPDNIMLHREFPIGPQIYYSLLNKFFDLVEKETGLEVIIAAHPRSSYEKMPDYFKGRRCIKDETIRLVRDSKLVLGQSSTALNFANIFYKPVIFMSFSNLSNPYEAQAISTIAKWFGKTPIIIDKPYKIDFNKELQINRGSYDNYRRAFIKTQGSQNLPFWQIVADSLTAFTK